MYPELIKIGIVGLGIGRWHIESFLSIPDVRVAAICDVNEEKLKRIAIRYGIARTYRNYEELCESDEIDAISICTPDDMHAEIAICSLENGKHILSENPIANSLADAEKVLEASRRFPDLKAMMAMRFRFNRYAIYTKNMIESGDLGKIYYGSTTYMGKNKNSSFHISGIKPVNDGLHLLDLTWWLMGSPDPVEAFGGVFFPNGDFADNDSHDSAGQESGNLSAGMVRFENGSYVTFESVLTEITDKEAMKMRIYGTRGIAMLWPLRVYSKKNGKIVAKTPSLPNIVSESQFRYFIHCIISNKQPISGIDHGVAILKMLDAVYRSVEEGKSIAI